MPLFDNRWHTFKLLTCPKTPAGERISVAYSILRYNWGIVQSEENVTILLLAKIKGLKWCQIIAIFLVLFYKLALQYLIKKKDVGEKDIGNHMLVQSWTMSLRPVQSQDALYWGGPALGLMLWHCPLEAFNNVWTRCPHFHFASFPYIYSFNKSAR